MTSTRLSRAEQVERNRALVLEAARRVFLERGYSGATLDAIAREAGFSKGVVYSQFAGKADLFLALLDERIAERAAENAAVVQGRSGLDGLLALLRANARRSADGPGWARLLIEFRVAASREPEVGRRYAEAHARAVDRFAEALSSVLAAGGLTPVRPPRTLAELIFAIDTGATLERAADPGALPVEFLEGLLTRLVEPS